MYAKSEAISRLLIGGNVCVASSLICVFSPSNHTYYTLFYHTFVCHCSVLLRASSASRKRDSLCAAAGRQGRVRSGGIEALLDEPDRLQETLGAGRLQADAAEFGDDMLDRAHVARRAGGAAFHRVAGEDRRLLLPAARAVGLRWRILRERGGSGGESEGCKVRKSCRHRAVICAIPTRCESAALPPWATTPPLMG